MKINKKLIGKFIIAFDTIFDGHQAVTDEVGKPSLFDSRDEAVREMFDGALSMLETRSKEELADFNEGITPKMVEKMKKINSSGDVIEMEKFFEKHPTANDNNEFVVPAEKFILGRKAIYTKKGLVITGKKL